MTLIEERKVTRPADVGSALQENRRTCDSDRCREWPRVVAYPCPPAPAKRRSSPPPCAAAAATTAYWSLPRRLILRIHIYQISNRSIIYTRGSTGPWLGRSSPSITARSADFCCCCCCCCAAAAIRYTHAFPHVLCTITASRSPNLPRAHFDLQYRPFSLSSCANSTLFFPE